MFTKKDVEFRSIFIIDCTTRHKSFRVSNGELLLFDMEDGKTLTKVPFQKILALFIIGNTTLTSPLIENCRKHNVAISIMKASLRPVAVIFDPAEANFLLRQKQYSLDDQDISIARTIVKNKVTNQKTLLKRTRKKDHLTLDAIDYCESVLDTIDDVDDYSSLLGLEGSASKQFFNAFYDAMEWDRRAPRTHCDPINTMLDIGYSILFNYLEVFVRLYGFDIYRGVYHRLWFRRKSLICDLMEPFRCIVDSQIRKSYNLGHFKPSDFKMYKGEYILKTEERWKYYSTFMDALAKRKSDVFSYVQSYYRAFMRNSPPEAYPQFIY